MDDSNYDQAVLKDELKKKEKPILHHKPREDRPFDEEKYLNDSTFFHQERAKPTKIDLDNLPIYTPKAFILCKDIHGRPWFKRSFISIFTGRTNCGKSHLLKELLFEMTKDNVYWKIRGVEAFSGTGKLTTDLDFLKQEHIEDKYDNTALNFKINNYYNQMVEMKKQGTTKELGHVVSIYDDMIGNSEDEKKQMNQKYGASAETWKLLATRGRRLPMTFIALTQNFQFMNNYVRDNAAYIFCCALNGSQSDYIWQQVRGRFLFSNRREFDDFCSKYILGFQCVVFYIHANDNRDFIRIVKANKECPPFTVPSTKPSKEIIQKRATEKFHAITNSLNKARIEEENSEESSSGWNF